MKEKVPLGIPVDRAIKDEGLKTKEEANITSKMVFGVVCVHI